jgi:Phage integrase family
MKAREQHIVPLSTQAIELLRRLHAITGPDGYVFPGLRPRTRPMSENTLNAALRRLGYGQDELTAHGFRSMASTLLNEQGWPPDVIEMQLAHAERNKVRAAYNRAERLDERRKMMQAWSDYLDGLKNGANVIRNQARFVMLENLSVLAARARGLAAGVMLGSRDSGLCWSGYAPSAPGREAIVDFERPAGRQATWAAELDAGPRCPEGFPRP